MDYARFLRLRRPLWEDFSRRLEALRDAPSRQAGNVATGDHRSRDRRRGAGASSYGEVEELAFAYRQVLHDHALAANRFPGTGAARQLAALALAGSRRLARRGAAPGGLRHFVFQAFPAAFHRQLGLLGVAAAVFGAASLLGLVLAAVQPGLGSLLLGPRALAGLAEGRLWTESLTTTVPPAVASSGIATNNLTVALVAWSGGVLAGVVPLYLLILNGLMLGGVIGITLRYSMAGELLGFVAAHGPLELTLIMVAAAAGLALGRALVAAGDRPRAEAMRQAGSDSLQVLLGCLPWFVVLAVVEARISPDPSLPATLKAALGLGLLLLFFGAALAPYHAAGNGASEGDGPRR
ncbi:MAG TPA: stage II sporulation protein M [Thermoanaerobaculia bacterium]|jgi:uncharacterized membrane protein SpoIIM required for sporulation|nr:stage II sporulation protein M [Thermoanaerobaculia bacterium]